MQVGSEVGLLSGQPTRSVVGRIRRAGPARHCELLGVAHAEGRRADAAEAGKARWAYVRDGAGLTSQRKHPETDSQQAGAAMRSGLGRRPQRPGLVKESDRRNSSAIRAWAINSGPCLPIEIEPISCCFHTERFREPAPLRHPASEWLARSPSIRSIPPPRCCCGQGFEVQGPAPDASSAGLRNSR